MNNPDGFMVRGISYPAKSISAEKAMVAYIGELEAECVRRKEAFESQWHLYRQATIVREEEIAALKAELARAREVVIKLWASEDLMLDFDGISTCTERAEARYKREIAQEDT